jgi:hypothetical protein
MQQGRTGGKQVTIRFSLSLVESSFCFHFRSGSIGSLQQNADELQESLRTSNGGEEQLLHLLYVLLEEVEW